MTFPLEIHKTLVLSISHVRESDLEIISDDLISYELDDFSGWLIWVNPEHVTDSVLIKYAASNALRAAIKLAQDNDCLYLKLDIDGPEVEGLPNFYW